MPAALFPHLPDLIHRLVLDLNLVRTFSRFKSREMAIGMACFAQCCVASVVFFMLKLGLPPGKLVVIQLLVSFRAE